METKFFIFNRHLSDDVMTFISEAGVAQKIEINIHFVFIYDYFIATDFTIRQNKAIHFLIFALNCQSIRHYAHLFRKTIM